MPTTRSGHALVAAKQSNSAPVTKITIVPRTSGALGYTMQVDEGEHYLMSKEELANKVATLTGGRAAEELIFGSVTTGASNDIEQATKLARAMITRYGMSTQLRHGGARGPCRTSIFAAIRPWPARRRLLPKIDEEVVQTVKDRTRKGDRYPAGKYGSPAPAGALFVGKGNHYGRGVHGTARKITVIGKTQSGRLSVGQPPALLMHLFVIQIPVDRLNAVAFQKCVASGKMFAAEKAVECQTEATGARTRAPGAAAQ